MPLPLTVSCFGKIQIGFTFLVPAYLGSPGKRAVKRVRVYDLRGAVLQRGLLRRSRTRRRVALPQHPGRLLVGRRHHDDRHVANLRQNRQSDATNG